MLSGVSNSLTRSVHLALKDWARASVAYEQARGMLEKLRGKRSKYVAAARVAMAVVAARRGQWAAVLRDTSSLLTEEFDADAERVLNETRYWRGLARIALKRADDAAFVETRLAAERLVADPRTARALSGEAAAWLAAHPDDRMAPSTVRPAGP